MERVGFHVISLRSLLRWAMVVALVLAAGLTLYRLVDAYVRGPARFSGVPVVALPLDQAAPDFSLPDLHGHPLQLAAFKGQPIVLVFWTTWCPGCVEGLTALETLHRRLRETHGLAVLAVNIMESAETVQPLVQQHGWTFSILLDGEGTVSTAYRIRIAPTVLLIDAHGVVRDRLLGELDGDLIAARLEPILPRSDPATAIYRP